MAGNGGRNGQGSGVWSVRVLSAGEMTQLHQMQRTAALAADQTEVGRCRLTL